MIMINSKVLMMCDRDPISKARSPKGRSPRPSLDGECSTPFDTSNTKNVAAPHGKIAIYHLKSRKSSS